jgi:hypothetical protein
MVSISETIDGESPVNFGFDDLKNITASFNIEVKTFFALFQPSTEFFYGNRMQQGIRVNSYIDDKQVSTRIDK